MSELGLEKRTVRLEAWSNNWRVGFEEAKESIEAALSAEGISATIVHVGSTAIRGMVAKPIIDLAIGVRTVEEMHAVRRVLTGGEWDYVPAANHPGVLFIALGRDELRFFHGHIVQKHKAAWQNLVVTRDYIRRHRAVAERYVAAKKAAAKNNSKNRIAYQQAKRATIGAIAVAALNLYRQRQIRGAIGRARQSRGGELFQKPRLPPSPAFPNALRWTDSIGGPVRAQDPASAITVSFWESLREPLTRPAADGAKRGGNPGGEGKPSKSGVATRDGTAAEKKSAEKKSAEKKSAKKRSAKKKSAKRRRA